MNNSIKIESIYKIDVIIQNINSKELDVTKNKYSYKENDKDGNTTLEINYDAFGTIAEKIVRKFDDRKFLVEEIYYDEGEEIAERKTYERNDDGTIKFEFTHYLDNSFDTLSYQYDGEKNVVSKILKDDEGFVESNEKFEYKNNKLVKKVVYDDNNKLIEELIYRYDENGNVLEYSNKEKDKYNNYRIVDEYDEKNNRVKSLKYNFNNKLVQISTYLFDEKNRAVKVINEDQNGITTTHLKYDDNDHLIFQEELNANDEINSSVERKYDESGNILQSKVFIDMHGMGMNQNYILKYEYEFFLDA